MLYYLSFFKKSLLSFINKTQYNYYFTLVEWDSNAQKSKLKITQYTTLVELNYHFVTQNINLIITFGSKVKKKVQTQIFTFLYERIEKCPRNVRFFLLLYINWFD